MIINIYRCVHVIIIIIMYNYCTSVYMYMHVCGCALYMYVVLDVYFSILTFPISLSLPHFPPTLLSLPYFLPNPSPPLSPSPLSPLPSACSS